MKTEAKQKAIQMRSRGYSLSEISEMVSASKSTISTWVRTVELSKHALKRIERLRLEGRAKASMVHRGQTDNKIKLASEYGQLVASSAKFNRDALRVLCAMLYWCEGVKIRSGSTFGFTNSDPLLVSHFMSLLRTCFKLDEQRFRLTVHVHDYHNKEHQLLFWSKVTSIPLAQCHKPYQKPHTGVRTRDGYAGCASIRYHDVEFARQLEGIAIAYLKMGL